jgi:hypothetical protein
MSLELYCRWSSTVAYKDIFQNYLKYWSSMFYCRWSSTVAMYLLNLKYELRSFSLRFSFLKLPVLQQHHTWSLNFEYKNKVNTHNNTASHCL